RRLTASRGSPPRRRPARSADRRRGRLLDRAALRHGRGDGRRGAARCVKGAGVCVADRARYESGGPMKVIVTRPKAQAGPLVDRLEELGHEGVECPLIEIERTSDEPIACAGDEWAGGTSPHAAGGGTRRAKHQTQSAAV